MSSSAIIRKPTDVIPFLERCGYACINIRENYCFGGSASVPVAAFAHEPCDARTACIAVTTSDHSPETKVQDLRKLGAPVVFMVGRDYLQWWQPGPESDKLHDSYPLVQAVEELDKHREELAPEQLFRAKNFGRHHKSYQLEFVDLGLLPFAEHEMGDRLSSLLEDTLNHAWQKLPKQKETEAKSRQFRSLFENLFHLLAGKILSDKGIPDFKELNISDPFRTIQQVRSHYNQQKSPLGTIPLDSSIVTEMATRLSSVSSFCNITTETLGAIYEKTLVSGQNRKLLGIHSTPSYLVDYIVWDLVDWISDIPLEDRHVYEPCCGHAGFLVGAMRMLRDLLFTAPSNATQSEHEYLRNHLHGLEIDPFAMEIARLGLTLADVPNPNGWDLRQNNIFKTEWPNHRAPAPGIVLMNPPFENFNKREREELGDVPLLYHNKAAEAFSRLVTKLQAGGVFGVILPETFIHKKEATSLREQLCSEFELREITLFPDKVFNFSDAESAVLLGRRKKTKSSTVWINRVDNWDINVFQKHQVPSDRQKCSQQRLRENPHCELRIPRLDDVWRELEHNPRFESIVKGGKGFEHKGPKNLPSKAITKSDTPFTGAVSAFTNFERRITLHELPRKRWVSLDPAVVASHRWGATTGQPQVLLNYAPVKRGPWRLKALIDQEGYAVTNRFLVFRPTDERVSLEVIWALLNSPIANAYAYCHLGKRDILSGTLLKMPIPRFSQEEIIHITWKVKQYLEATRNKEDQLQATCKPDDLKDLLLQIDAEVLRLYNLPPRMERQVLDIFSGHERVGVPFKFTEYFPRDYEPYIPLHEYLSEEYKQTTAGELRKRLHSFDDPDISRALKIAREAFTTEEED